MVRDGDGVNPPEYVGSYAVERELGAGGMGTVYLARSRGGRTVAVKVARPELAADPHFRARFRAEVEAARRVGGFHTAQVVDADPEAAAPWLATAYIAGPTLSELLATQGAMGEAQLLLLGAALAEALQAIHACGLVHRDLKPGNIIMADDGPRVLDFGIARALESSRLTSTGAAFGTPGFLAPEQAQGLEVDAAADVFALGAVLVAAAGGRAFGEGTPMGLMYRAVHEEPDLSALSARVRPMVAACLAKDPARRPTPKGLLDLFAPSVAPRPTAVVRSLTMPDAPPVAPAPMPTAPTAPTAPASTPVTGPGAGGVAGAMTAAAAPGARTRAASPGHRAGNVPNPPNPPRQPRPPRLSRLSKKARKVLLVATAVIVLGGGGFGAYELSDASFPELTHELTAPTTLAGGAYKHDGSSSLAPDKRENGVFERDVKDLWARYKDATDVTEVRLSGAFGRFKFVELKLDSALDATDRGDDTVVEEARTVRPPGGDVDLRCEATNQQTVCGWGDVNSIVVVKFTPGPTIEEAAAETQKIRTEIRKPVKRG